MAFATAFLALTALALSLGPIARLNDWAAPLSARAWEPWLIVGVWAACAWSANRVLERRLPEHDPILLQAALLLMGWGALLVWRLLPDYGLRQAAWIVVGTAALLVSAATDGVLRSLRRYRYLLLSIALGLTALTFIIGLDPAETGARLWLGALGVGVFFQPSELLKLTLIAFLAAYLAERRPAPGALRAVDVAPVLAVWGVSIVLVVAQRDLGAGVLLFGGALVVSFVATGQRRLLALGTLLILGAAFGGYAVFDVVRARVAAWIDPFADPIGGAYQIVQALIAEAAGGVLGRGPGLGNPGLVPLAHSDFIFSAIAEEWGLSGSLAVVGLQALLAARSLRAAFRARSAFDQLLAVGLASLSAMQTMLIVGGALRVVPLTGVTLPFVSYGGSSLLAQCLMLGLILRVSDRDRPRLPASTSRPATARARGEVMAPARRSALRLTATLMAVGFAMLGTAMGYWSLIRGVELNARPDNARRALLEWRYERGRILDRNGQVLAESILVDDRYSRVYPYPGLGPVLGYSSALYGAAGIEATADSALHGDLETDSWDRVRGLAVGDLPTPRSLKLTLDLDLQRQVDLALGQRAGAVVVLDIDSGDVLGLASHPGYDPNQLDARWPDLTSDPTAPLLNRASAALYQPGSALYPALYALGVQSGLIHPDEPAPGGASPIQAGSAQLGCRAPGDDLTWATAVLLRCPAPFERLARQLERERVAQLWRDLGLFTAPVAGLPTAAAIDEHASTDPNALLGQGVLTMTPLHYARIVAAWAQRGEVPTPRLILAEQEPGGTWQTRSPIGGTVAAFTPTGAEVLQDLIVQGYAARAVAGEGATQRDLAWFGLAAPADTPEVAVVVLLEGGSEGDAEAIGRAVAAAVTK